MKQAFPIRKGLVHHPTETTVYSTLPKGCLVQPDRPGGPQSRCTSGGASAERLFQAVFFSPTFLFVCWKGRKWWKKEVGCHEMTYKFLRGRQWIFASIRLQDSANFPVWTKNPGSEWVQCPTSKTKNQYTKQSFHSYAGKTFSGVYTGVGFLQMCHLERGWVLGKLFEEQSNWMGSITSDSRRWNIILNSWRCFLRLPTWHSTLDAYPKSQTLT